MKDKTIEEQKKENIERHLAYEQESAKRRSKNRIRSMVNIMIIAICVIIIIGLFLHYLRT